MFPRMSGRFCPRTPCRNHARKYSAQVTMSVPVPKAAARRSQIRLPPLRFFDVRRNFEICHPSAPDCEHESLLYFPGQQSARRHQKAFSTIAKNPFFAKGLVHKKA